MLEILLGAFIGTVFSVITTMWIESQKLPKIKIEIAQGLDVVFQMKNVEGQEVERRGHVLRFYVINDALPAPMRWLSRGAIVRCYANIVFRSTRYQGNVYGEPILARWTGSPQPTRSYVIVGKRKFPIVDPVLIDRIDIPAGEKEELDVVIRFEGQDGCSIWNNESYLSASSFVLPIGTYLVDVNVFSAGQRTSKTFRLVNELQDFRLTHEKTDDRVPE